jgi:hypothetical protein
MTTQRDERGLQPLRLDRLPDLIAALGARASEHDRDGSFPAAGISEVRAAGLLTATVAHRYGGPGTGLAGTVAILRALGRGDPSVALIAAMTLFAHAMQDAYSAYVLAYEAARFACIALLAHQGLRVLRRHHVPQPCVRSTQPGGIIRHGLIGHALKAPTPARTRQIDTRRTRQTKENAYLAPRQGNVSPDPGGPTPVQIAKWALLACCGEVLSGAGAARPSDNKFAKGRTSGTMAG